MVITWIWQIFVNKERIVSLSRASASATGKRKVSLKAICVADHISTHRTKVLKSRCKGRKWFRRRNPVCVSANNQTDNFTISLFQGNLASFKDPVCPLNPRSAVRPYDSRFLRFPRLFCFWWRDLFDLRFAYLSIATHSCLRHFESSLFPKFTS